LPELVMPPFHERASHLFPRLPAQNYRETSSATWNYNCVAWALRVINASWWPLPGRHWPDGIAREETLPAFLAAFATVGFVPGASPLLELDIEKVALYAVGPMPTHAARLLPGGWWTSKLGPSIDIEHATPEDVAGGVYGEVVAILGRSRTATAS
jgi:hypothetical protein